MSSETEPREGVDTSFSEPIQAREASPKREEAGHKVRVDPTELKAEEAHKELEEGMKGTEDSFKGIEGKGNEGGLKGIKEETKHQVEEACKPTEDVVPVGLPGPPSQNQSSTRNHPPSRSHPPSRNHTPSRNYPPPRNYASSRGHSSFRGRSSSRNHTSSQIHAPSRDQSWRHSTLPIDIMLLGPSGSGKSSLINMVTSSTSSEALEGTGPRTTQFRITRTFPIGEQLFRLIDSPGLHTGSRGEMKRLIEYLVRSQGGKSNIRLAGILYLHPEGKDMDNERLKGTMEAIRHLVGDQWLQSIIIAATRDKAAADSDAIARLCESASPYYSLTSRDARVLAMSFESSSIREVLLHFKPSSSTPQFLQKVTWNPGDHAISGLDGLLDEIPKPPRRETSGKIGRPHKITPEESEANYQQLRADLNETTTELNSLRTLLKQTQSEYASLRSELQLNDNTEQSTIIQLLGDLNRAIDGFGRSVAMHTVDNCPKDCFNQTAPTTLNAADPSGLQHQFGHQAGEYSLAMSSEGDGLPIEHFIDFALRSVLCQKLCENIFAPFHPTLATGPESNFMISLYKKIRREASSTFATKWRASAFMALCEGNKVDKPTVEIQADNLVSGSIQPVLNNLFGQINAPTLIESQHRQLRDIVNMAWELNYLLKGEVVALGDFHPLFYERGVPFNPEAMDGFEPNQQRKPDDVVVCTVKLGLALSYPEGGGKDPNSRVVCHATVITPAIYEIFRSTHE